MRHEKIFRREDKSRVRITVSVNTGFGQVYPQWGVLVHTVKPRKSTWRSVDPRNVSCNHPRAVVIEHVTEQEVLETMRELWQKIEPKDWANDPTKAMR